MAKEKEYIRVPGTTTLLVCVLDRILREHLQFPPYRHPGWTFEHSADYRVPDGAGYDHECSSYLAGARVEGPTRAGLECFMEVRVHALKNNWTALPSHGSELWTFVVWAKTPGRNILPKVYIYSEQDNHLFLSDQQPNHTPRKIDLWWRQPLSLDPVPVTMAKNPGRPLTKYRLRKSMSRKEIAEALGLENQDPSLWMPSAAFYVEVDGPSYDGCDIVAEMDADESTVLVVGLASYAAYHQKIRQFADYVAGPKF